MVRRTFSVNDSFDLSIETAEPQPIAYGRLVAKNQLGTPVAAEDNHKFKYEANVLRQLDLSFYHIIITYGVLSWSHNRR